ncbi:hypothetical protein G6F60_011347 [Rhizopus arrhizus]|nr:hypothetical protein G6F60_011347 [Rhizopus arrhizus]
MTAHTIYEDDDISKFILAQKAQSIVQQALAPGSVLFSLPSQLFDHYTDAYKLIEEQLGEAMGFHNISRFDVRSNSKDLLIEVKFTLASSVQKALTVGFNYKNLNFKGAPATGEQQRNLIKQYKCRGYFEGDVSLMIDVSTASTDDFEDIIPIQPLKRMLYLEAWDIHVPATYKGAPPVCHYCRKSGHVKAKCPVLASHVCYSCGKSGHTRRFCKKKELTEGEELDTYLAASQQSLSQERNKTGKGSAVTERRPSLHDSVLNKNEDTSDRPVLTDLMQHDENTMAVDKEDCPPYNPDDPSGPLASKHAPATVRSIMPVDTSTEMSITDDTDSTMNEATSSVNTSLISALPSGFDSSATPGSTSPSSSRL